MRNTHHRQVPSPHTVVGSIYSRSAFFTCLGRYPIVIFCKAYLAEPLPHPVRPQSRISESVMDMQSLILSWKTPALFVDFNLGRHLPSDFVPSTSCINFATMYRFSLQQVEIRSSYRLSAEFLTSEEPRYPCICGYIHICIKGVWHSGYEAVLGKPN